MQFRFCGKSTFLPHIFLICRFSSILWHGSDNSVVASVCGVRPLYRSGVRRGFRSGAEWYFGDMVVRGSKVGIPAVCSEREPLGGHRSWLQRLLQLQASGMFYIYIAIFWQPLKQCHDASKNDFLHILCYKTTVNSTGAWNIVKKKK